MNKTPEQYIDLVEDFARRLDSAIAKGGDLEELLVEYDRNPNEEIVEALISTAEDNKAFLDRAGQLILPLQESMKDEGFHAEVVQDLSKGAFGKIERYGDMLIDIYLEQNDVFYKRAVDVFDEVFGGLKTLRLDADYALDDLEM